jgi:hypothetical protein
MGLKNRILRRDADPVVPIAVDDTAEHPVPAPVEPAPQGDPLTGPIDPQPAPAHPEPAPGEHVPQGDPLSPPAEDAPADAAAVAGIEPLAPRRPGFRERGQLRRRLRFLREARELGFRDLGGLVFDQHRFQRPNDALVQGKVAAIDGVDRELRVIEDVLAARRPYEELFVAGVSACPRCGALHGSDARFCPHCGLDFRGPRSVAGMWTDGAASAATATSPGQSALFDPQAAPADMPAPPPPA